MNALKIAGVLVAALLVVGGTAAALPGNAPADAQAQNNTENESADPADKDRRGPPEDVRRDPPAAGDPGQAGAERGPPTDMPAQAPDFTGELHQLIHQFVSGEFDGDLGGAISDITPDGDAAENGTEAEMDDEADEDDTEADGEQTPAAA